PMKSSMFLRVLSGASVIVLVLLGCAGAQSQTTQRSNFTRGEELSYDITSYCRTPGPLPGTLLLGESLELVQTGRLAEHRAGATAAGPVFNCGGELIADSGFVGSEGFPSYYKPDRKCTWYITVPEGHVVMLSFRVFDLEADPQCRFDYVEVYNGHSHTAQRLGRFCGTFRPGALISTSHRMMVEMVSDSGTGGRGFLGYFNGGKPHVDEHQFCGGKLTKSQGSVKTPNWPEKDYPAGISCSWHIIVESNMVIEVTFDKFDLEHDSYCRYDYVAFFNGGESDDSRRIGKYCGDIAPGTIVSNGNELLVHVTSDGFMATYTSIPRGSKPSTVAGEENGLGPQLVPEPAAKPPSKPGPKPPAKPAVTKPVKPKPTLKPKVTPAPGSKPKTTAKAPVKPSPKPGTKPAAKPTAKPTAKPGGVKPGPKPAVRPGLKPARNGTRVVLRRPGPNDKNGAANPLCAQGCKRTTTIQSSFCSSEFVITGKVTTVATGPRDSLYVSVSLIHAYKAGRLRITQAGKTMSVKLVSACKKCPLIRRGANYILMGQVDDEGRGLLSPNSFTLLYKAPHQKMLTNLNSRPC
ncbi:PCOC2 endopeptidase, partial [Atractosteus spatula]|nr:PCOC2 endopeptidase [Atractosteus spatula]